MTRVSVSTVTTAVKDVTDRDHDDDDDYDTNAYADPSRSDS